MRATGNLSMGLFERALAAAGEGARPFLTLTRHFFHRFFQNDFVDFEDQMKEQVILVIAILAVFFGQAANAALFSYTFEPSGSPAWLDAWIPKTYFLSLFMTLMGFITVLEWDVVFPDSRDFLNLMSLPIRTRTWFASKFASFLLFIGMFSLGSNIMAVFVFPYHLSSFKPGDLAFLGAVGVGHIVSAILAGLFIFLAIVGAQGILMTFLPSGLFRRVSGFVRFLLLVGFIVLLLSHITGSFGFSYRKGFSWFEGLKTPGAAWGYLYPPLWFTGIHEVIVGNKDRFFLAQARAGIAGIVGSILLFILTFAVSYARQIRKSLEVKIRRNPLGQAKRSLAALFNAVVLRNPTQRAVFAFSVKTFLRSNRHKIQLASYMACGIALIMILLASAGFGQRFFDPRSPIVAAIPLILSFFLLVGIRLLINVPVTAGANWVFRITEAPDGKNYFIGVKKAVAAVALIPLHAVLLGAYAPVWGWKDAGRHLGFCLLASLLLMEILFFRHSKIPFACTYVPMKAKAYFRWFLYGLAFLAYAWLLPLLERNLMKDVSEFLAFCGIFAGLVVAVETANIAHFYRKNRIVYEDEPEAILVTL